MQSASNVCLVLPFHDGAHVDASISSFVALTDDADAQEVDRVYKTQSKALQSEHDLLLSRSCAPRLSVTVTMLSDMVESVMLLMDEARLIGIMRRCFRFCRRGRSL